VCCQQTLRIAINTATFHRAMLFIVHCRLQRIHRNLLPVKCRYHCTRLHGATPLKTMAYIFASIGDKGSFAIHLHILQLRLGHLGQQFARPLLTVTTGLTCKTSDDRNRKMCKNQKVGGRKERRHMVLF
jgi:hypothetical protein